MKNILRIKEPVNALTHFAVFVISIAGLIFLITKSKYSISKLTTMTIYGVSIVLMYGASSLYHWIKTTPRKLMILKKLDHIAIYLLISGTFLSALISWILFTNCSTTLFKISSPAWALAFLPSPE